MCKHDFFGRPDCSRCGMPYPTDPKEILILERANHGPPLRAPEIKEKRPHRNLGGQGRKRLECPKCRSKKVVLGETREGRNGLVREALCENKNCGHVWLSSSKVALERDV